MSNDLLNDLDHNIVSLVVELNSFPGISTFSSCGGHLHPTALSQCPEGVFQINFNVYPLHGGWRSLELIASAVSESADHGKLSITLWSMGGGGSVCFELSGCDHADPDRLAEFLTQLRLTYDDNLSDV
jgi:hypothetical protein